MFWELLAFQDSETECVDAATPVQVSVSVVVEGCALLVKVNVAVTAPATVGLHVTVKLALCPAAMVCGSEKALTVNTELLVVAAVTVTVAPLAVKVPVAVPLEPTVTLPRARVAGDTLRVPAVVAPVPESGIVRVGLVAVDVIVRFPVTAPLAVGANETVKVAPFPAASVSGVVIPLTPNPDPVIATWLTEMLVLPVLVMVSERDPLPPTFTFPNLRLVGFAASAPGATPVADTGTVNVGFVAFEVTVRLPLTAPATVGTNVTVSVALCPPLRVSGVVMPLTVRPVPVIPTWETVTLEPPVLVIVSESDP